MVIAQIKGIKLTGAAADTLSFSAYKRIQEWLTSFTAENNFKSIVAESVEDADNKLQQILRAELVPYWAQAIGVTPYHFCFNFGYADVNDGKFWFPSTANSSYRSIL